jgi:hypothetical protein
VETTAQRVRALAGAAVARAGTVGGALTLH